MDAADRWGLDARSTPSRRACRRSRSTRPGR